MYSKRRIAVISNTIVYTMKRGCSGNGYLRIELSPMIWLLTPRLAGRPYSDDPSHSRPTKSVKAATV